MVKIYICLQHQTVQEYIYISHILHFALGLIEQVLGLYTYYPSSVAAFLKIYFSLEEI